VSPFRVPRLLRPVVTAPSAALSYATGRPGASNQQAHAAHLNQVCLRTTRRMNSDKIPPQRRLYKQL